MMGSHAVAERWYRQYGERAGRDTADEPITAIARKLKRGYYACHTDCGVWTAHTLYYPEQ